METIAKLLSARIRKRREEMGLTQTDVADLAGIHLRTFQGIENEGRWPHLGNLIAIAGALKVDPHYLFQAETQATAEEALDVLKAFVERHK